jgi:hypothetical protein
MLRARVGVASNTLKTYESENAPISNLPWVWPRFIALVPGLLRIHDARLAVLFSGLRLLRLSKVAAVAAILFDHSSAWCKFLTRLPQDRPIAAKAAKIFPPA